MSVSTLPAFLDALVAALEARPGLAGVTIYSGPVAPEDIGEAGIEFAEDVSIDQTRAAMGSTDMDESYSVTGSVLAAAPIVPKATKTATINAAAKVARDRAFAILHEITAELATNDDMTDTVRDVAIATLDVHQAMAPEAQQGRACWVEFSLSVVARTSP